MNDGDPGNEDLLDNGTRCIGTGIGIGAMRPLFQRLQDGRIERPRENGRYWRNAPYRAPTTLLGRRALARQNSLDWCSAPYRAAEAHNFDDCKLVFDPDVFADSCTIMKFDRRVASKEEPECCQPARRQHDERLVA